MHKLIYTTTLLILSALPSIGLAQVEAKIVADDIVQPGDLVVLDGSRSSNAIHYVWKLINSEKRFLVFEDGEKVVTAFGTEGKYRFLLIVVGQDNNGSIRVSDAEHTITVGDGVTPDKPDPVKPDEPDKPDPVKPDKPDKPDIDDDQFNNLGQQIVDRSIKYMKADGLEIANRIGGNYLEVAEDLENGDVFLNDVFSRTAKMNKEVYTTDGIYDEELHLQFIRVGSVISDEYMNHKDSFDRDVMIDFLKVIGNAFQTL